MSAGLKQKTHKVLDLEVEGYNFICIVHYEQMRNPYHLYVKWNDGQNRLKQVERYGNFISVVEHICMWMRRNNVGYKEWF